MDFKTFFNQVLEDIKTDIAEEFDRNFERKGFFNKKWPTTKLKNNRGSLMMRTGNLRRSIKSKVSKNGRGGEIQFASSLPYASIHNSGGEIKVTAKMKRYFWAMYYKAYNPTQVYSVRTRKQVNTQRTQRLSEEAAQWKAMALKKVGDTITIPERKFIGNHPHVMNRIKGIIHENFKQLKVLDK